MEVRDVTFRMDTALVAPCVYAKTPHRTTNQGYTLSPTITEELQCFLSGFNTHAGIERKPYYRLDAYFDESTLYVLEINASFVDGWGTALNLSRASGIKIDPQKLIFPKRFTCTDGTYLPEMRLFLEEMEILGIDGCKICPLQQDEGEPTYVYGRVGTKDQPHILPYDGLRLDNKLHLARFGQTWAGQCVRVPQHFVHPTHLWSDIPETDVVLKFCDKGSAECKRAGHSVLFYKPPGKAPFIRGCYNKGQLLAQARVPPAQRNGQNCQLIIFAIGDQPVTGYVQYSPDRLVTDDSVHGPLQLY